MSENTSSAHSHDTVVAIKCEKCTKELGDCECTAVCEECDGEGKVACFEDMWCHVTEGHYTRDWDEECGECDGTGKVPMHKEGE